MKNKIKQIFKQEKGIVIGSLHFPPLLGFSEFPGYKKSVAMAMKDLAAYENGGSHGLFLENNYGLSAEKIETSHAIAMGYLIGEIRKNTKLPLGASVLWNDYEAAFALAKTYDLDFIRIPVFVDEVETYCGRIKGDPKHIKKVRSQMEAEHVAIFADILVKHSKHISTHSLQTAAKKAIKAGADALIITGDWTGDAPSSETVAHLREKIGNFPIIIGSGVDSTNVSALLESANGIIVSTSLKQGLVQKGERNVKGFEQRVLLSKVKTLVQNIKKR